MSDCTMCGKQMTSWAWHAKYCSSACKQKAYRQRKAAAATAAVTRGSTRNTNVTDNQVKRNTRKSH